jgi:predicted phosphodiesterase
MLRDYEVISAGHIHAGRALAIGEVIALAPGRAERYPQVFKEKRAPIQKAVRRARSATTATTEEE